MNILLVGNPNCGKTTLFNILTKSYNKTGNWTGVTVKEKSGLYYKDNSINVIDLPGIYSLAPSSLDEKCVLNSLKKNKIDLILNVVDGTNLIRNLYLTISLFKLNIPIVIAVNFADQISAENQNLISSVIAKEFNVPNFFISAKNKQGTFDLIEKCVLSLKTAPKTKVSKNIIRLNEKEYYSYLKANFRLKEDNNSKRAKDITKKIDNILLNKYSCIPLSFVIIFLVYFVSSKMGGYLSGLLDGAFADILTRIKLSLFSVGIKTPIVGMIVDGVLKGLLSVLTFFPQVLIIFLLLTMLEETGVMSRLAYIYDEFFYKLGLGGKCLMPLFLSCGCAVSGIMSTRSIDSDGERIKCIYLSPFMPCGAKMAVFSYFSFAMFGGNALIPTIMYFLSILCVVIGAVVLNKIIKTDDKDSLFIFEMPILRLLTIKDLMIRVYEKTKEFMVKVASVMFCVSLVVWILSNFGFKGYTEGVIEKSFLFFIGDKIKYVFYPLGFYNYESSVAILTGILAKEGVIETLNLLVPNIGVLFTNWYTAFSFMAFILLSPPCLSALITAKSQLKSKKLFNYMLLFQFLMAYSVAFLINVIGFLVDSHLSLIFLFFCCIIILLTFSKSIKKIITPCKNCATCKKVEKCQKPK